MPGKGDAEDIFPCYCTCHDHPQPATGLYTCGECGFVSEAFEDLERHVYSVHLVSCAAS